MNRIVNMFKQPAPDGTYEDAARRQAYAEALKQSAMRQRGPQAGGPVQAQYGIGEGLTQLAEALLARRAGKAALEAKRQAEANQRGRNLETMQTMMPATDSATVRMDPETGAYRRSGSTIANMQPEALALALRDMDPQKVAGVLAEKQLGNMFPEPQDPYTLGVGERRFDGGNKMVAEGAAPAEKQGKHDTYEKTLPNGMMQTYVMNDATGKMEPFGDPYKPVDKNPNITIGGGASAKPVWREVQDPNDPNNKVWVDLNNPGNVGPPSGNKTATGKDEPRRNALDALILALDEVEKASAVLGEGGGPIEGRIPAIGDATSGYDAAVASLLAAGQAAMRTPGIGSQSNLELQALMQSLPTRQLSSENRAKQIARIRARIQEIINRPEGEAAGGNAPAAPAAGKEVVVDW